MRLAASKSIESGRSPCPRLNTFADPLLLLNVVIDERIKKGTSIEQAFGVPGPMWVSLAKNLSGVETSAA